MHTAKGHCETMFRISFQTFQACGCFETVFYIAGFTTAPSFSNDWKDNSESQGNMPVLPAAGLIQLTSFPR